MKYRLCLLPTKGKSPQLDTAQIWGGLKQMSQQPSWNLVSEKTAQNVTTPLIYMIKLKLKSDNKIY